MVLALPIAGLSVWLAFDFDPRRMVILSALEAGFYFYATGSLIWMELLFLSFTTLSGVGLGDIVPLTPMARALVMIEEFSGVMYLALVVSRLIALSVTTRRAV